jgi:hypothetical protein
MLLHLSLLRTHICIDPTMGNWWCFDSCGLYDDAWCLGYQLELPWRLNSGFCDAYVHAILILDRLRSDCWNHVLRHHQFHYMGCCHYLSWQSDSSRLR